MLLQACAGFMIPAVQAHVLDEPFAGINPVVKDTLIDLIQQREPGNGRDLPDRQPRDGDRPPHLSARDGDDPGQVAAEGPLDEIAAPRGVITAYLGRSLQ